ncbi:hypothetical protein DFH29DRAFT_534215 [Suillus ampliporus]|nr:hypothetical protein DFH29DRAFT_534215 [Suillus ampliporus]
MMRPSPGPSWTVLAEPPSTSPAPTTQSEPASDLGDDEEDNLNTPPGKRKAIESPLSVTRPQKVPRLNDNNQRENRAEVSSAKRTNGAAPGSLTQPPKIARKSHSSFLSQLTRPPSARPEKGKDRTSSGESISSMGDKISTMLQKQNARYKRAETARKSARKTTGGRRVSTSDLIRAVQKSSSSSEVSSAATRVRRGQPHDLPVCFTLNVFTQLLVEGFRTLDRLQIKMSLSSLTLRILRDEEGTAMTIPSLS